MRVGIGYDAHVLTAGRPLILGGVSVPYDRGLDGYSDADVLVHAIIDALLGAAGLEDIGHQYPTGDLQYKGASSIHLLEQTGLLIGAHGFIIKNVDSVLIAQEPKIATYIEEMCHNIAQALGISDGQVMVKATTTDGLGFTGKGEGMAAQAVVLIEE